MVKKNKEQEKTLRNTLIVLGAIVVGFVIFFLFMNSQESFEYRGVEFEVVKFCDSGPPCLVTYNTKVPVSYQGKSANYNFFLRNDPRQLEKEVPFNGGFSFKDQMDMDITFNTACEGFEKIAVQNLLTLYKVANVNISGSGNASCDLSGERMYILLQESNETYIEQFGPACYTINIKECEILKGTERLMTETFVKINEALRN